MDLSSPEVVAGRAVAVVVIEQLIRARTALMVWGVAALAALLVVGTVMSDGLGAVLLGLLALVVAAVSVTLFAVRALVLRALRRVGGGRDHDRVRPIVERHMKQVREAQSVLSLDPPGPFRLARYVRRPTDLRDEVRDAAATVARTMPEVVSDVRAELARPRTAIRTGL